ncbi:MAG TPA: hypothetical protein VGE68_11510 [Sphingomicrobium sp.]
MKLAGVAAFLVLASLAVPTVAKLPPLHDPVFMNIGFVCQWQNECIDRQQKAMKRALAFTKKYDPPSWKIHLCNRRAVQRRSGRIDWISYNNCVRNPALGGSSSASRSPR